MNPVVFAALVAASSLQTLTQDRPRIGVPGFLQAGFAGSTRDLLAAAEKMPEGEYGFKPGETASARTFGAVIAHAADGMFGACAGAKGEANPNPGLERSLSAKADIVRALAASVDYCRAVFASLTDQNASEFVRHGPVDVPRAAALMGVLAHNAEMFGISTVYLRARNLVPPGSDRD